jgi:hypothetical protein
MLLKNASFRSFLRYVIASDISDMKKAYRLVFSQFGKDTEKASEAIWKWKDTQPYSAIGFDRISKKTITTIFDLIKNKSDTADVTVRKQFLTDILEYIQRGSALHTTEVDIESETDINRIKRFKNNINAKLYKRYKGQQFTVNEIYNILNKARIDQDLQEILNNPTMYARIMEDTTTKAPGYPQGKFSSEYISTLPMNLRVVLRYIDSFEN